MTFSGAAALPLRTKGENHKKWAVAPLLRFSPFEIPFPYLPPGSLHVGKFYRISAFCPTRGGSVWLVDSGFYLLSHLIYCIHQIDCKASDSTKS